MQTLLVSEAIGLVIVDAPNRNSNRRLGGRVDHTCTCACSLRRQHRFPTKVLEYVCGLSPPPNSLNARQFIIRHTDVAIIHCGAAIAD